MTNKKYIKGFTLIELLIFMGLFSVILVVLSSLFAATVQQQLETQAISAVESDTSYIISRFQYDFDRATSVITPSTYGETSNSLTLVIDGQDYTYALDGTNLRLTTGTNSYVLQGSRSLISNLFFSRIGNIGGNPTIRVQMTLTSLAGNSTGNESSTIDTVFSIR